MISKENKIVDGNSFSVFEHAQMSTIRGVQGSNHEPYFCTVNVYLP